MRHDTAPRRWAGLVAFLCATWPLQGACAPQVGAQSAEVERTYTFSRNSDSELLEIGPSQGSAVVPVKRFTLYGDGRLVCRTVDRHDQEAEEPVEIWLSAQEVEATMKSVVDAGLVEYHPEDMKDRMNGPLVYAFQSTGGGLFLRAALDSYESPSRAEAEPFVHQTGFSSPMLLREEYERRRQAGKLGADAPETFVELEAALALYERLQSLVLGR